MPQRATFKVPRLYKAAAKVTSVIKNENGNLEQLVNQYNKQTNAKALAALVSKVVKNEDILDKILENSQILLKEPKEDPWLFRVLIAELLLGKQRLPIGSKTIQTVLSYGTILRTELMKAQGKNVGKLKKYIADDYDDSGSPSSETKINESKSAEFNDGMKSQKRKNTNKFQKGMEVDNLQYQPKSKKVKKSKNIRKGSQEIDPDVNEEDESIDNDEELPISISGEEQDCINLEDGNDESTSVEHKPTQKKGEK